MHPTEAISTRNFPRPAYTSTYITTSWRDRTRDYIYDSARYQPHVYYFHDVQRPYWGNRWRYGCDSNSSFGTALALLAILAFAHYVYTPYYASCAPTPYYYDPYVPPYLPVERVVVWPNYRYDWRRGRTYRYIYSEPYSSYGDPLLNLAIHNLLLAYRDRNPRYIDPLLGTGDVAIFANNRYEYSCDSDDFRSLMADNCRACRTVSFDVISVRHEGDYGIVRCRHRFATPDGHRHSADLYYDFRRVGDRYALVDYMTSDVY